MRSNIYKPKMSNFRCLCILMGVAFGLNVFANEIIRPKDAKELQILLSPLKRKKDLSEETLFGIKEVEVAYINEWALKRDFPVLRNLNRLQLEQWILSEAAYLTSTQKQLEGLRMSEVPWDLNRKKQAFTPRYWGRAAIIEVHDPQTGAVVGMIDLKGIGNTNQNADDVGAQISDWKEDHVNIDSIRISDHSDGLMSLGEAAAEVARGAGIQALLDLENQKVTDYDAHQSVESYFILNLSRTSS